MEALVKGAKKANKWLREAREEATPIRHIQFYTDNTGAIHQIYKATLGKTQACSIHFCNSMHDILDRQPNCDIVIEWVPSHQDIIGNEAANHEASWGHQEEITHLYWCGRKNAPSLRTMKITNLDDNSNGIFE